MIDQVNIRQIQAEDNVAIASIIRAALKEFGADRPGTVYYDDTTDHLFELFQTPKSIYFIASLNEEIIGGGGLFPSPGLPDGTCELVKMYLKPEARGNGVSSKIIQLCIEAAHELGYKKIYLESMPELSTALKIYEKKGWKYLSGPMGNTGHTGCGLWMLLEL